MICLSDKLIQVDLYTLDRDLEDAMLSEYPDAFDPTEQYHLDTSDQDVGKQYCFYKLCWATLKDFLANKRFKDSKYQIRNSITRQVLLDTMNKAA